MMKSKFNRQYQRGAATLIIAMALMVATSSLVLAAVHAQLLNSRITGNTQDAVMNYLLAEAGLDYAIEYLQTDFYHIAWTASQGNVETTQPGIAAQWLNRLDTQSRRLELVLTRSTQNPAFITVASRVFDKVNNRISLEISQTTRPLSILSPAGEQAPPLILDGCVLSVTGFPDLYPGNYQGKTPTPALWSSRPSCHPQASLDLHQGTISNQRFKPGELWNLLFSVNRTEYSQLVNDEVTKNIHPQQRRYWQVSASDLQGNRWTRSIGSPRRPVVLVFPDSLGCPTITHGTTIYGIVYYAADCTITRHPLEGNINGTLAINGSLGSYSESLNLSHISRVSKLQHHLTFPILNIPRLAGTWRDF